MSDAPNFMLRALELAARGEGCVEPNPMVGAVLVRDDQIVGEGWHQEFGGPHAEAVALEAAGDDARGATLHVTLEPCCHTGKTPPCADAVIAAGVARVVVATGDPFPQVDGGGIAKLEAAGIECEVGDCQAEANALLAPYLKLTSTGRPWVIAKWAMTLDGKIATRTGSSKWISGTESRDIVQQLRGRVDAIVVGGGTAQADDPLLTARPPGPRVATRIVLGDVCPDSKLAQTIDDAPLLVVLRVPPVNGQYDWLQSAGGELLVLEADSRQQQITHLLDELGSRQMTNVLVEGGGQLLGAFFDANAIDEVRAFIAPKLVGGGESPSPIAGHGIELMPAALGLLDTQIEVVGTDVYVRGRIDRNAQAQAK